MALLNGMEGWADFAGVCLKLYPPANSDNPDIPDQQLMVEDSFLYLKTGKRYRVEKAVGLLGGGQSRHPFGGIKINFLFIEDSLVCLLVESFTFEHTLVIQ